jgi:superfamily I DNA/RNA helicase
MKERIAEALEREGLHRERRELEGAAISTIHAFCARLLREHAIHARVDPRFSVLEQVEADGLRRQAFEERTAAWRESRATDLGTLGLVRATRLAAEVLDLHDRVRAAGIDPATFVAGGTRRRRRGAAGARRGVPGAGRRRGWLASVGEDACARRGAPRGLRRPVRGGG